MQYYTWLKLFTVLTISEYTSDTMLSAEKLGYKIIRFDLNWFLKSIEKRLEIAMLDVSGCPLFSFTASSLLY